MNNEIVIMLTMVNFFGDLGRGWRKRDHGRGFFDSDQV